MLKLVEKPKHDLVAEVLTRDKLPKYLSDIAEALDRESFKVFSSKLAPIVLDDSSFDIGFDNCHEYLRASYYDSKTKVTSYFHLYNVSAYGILGNDKICDCERLTIEYM